MSQLKGLGNLFSTISNEVLICTKLKASKYNFLVIKAKRNFGKHNYEKR